ncbi:MAG: DUF4349 domain-containing protein [Oscillospiraceae bacterium]|nr:DUF4349 domain-containing protein [Oscillospiraceae bacterium]
MKKRLSLILAVILIMVCLTGCGGAAKDSAAYDNGTSSGSYGGSPEASEESFDMEADYSYTTDTLTGEPGSAIISGVQVDMSEKIIYTAHADIETIDFDGSVEKVYGLLEQYNAFIENSYVTGKSYSTEFYGHQSYRVAEFTIRVPREYYSALTSSLDVLGNVISINSSVDNITTQYIDTQSRLDTYRIEEDRLLAMLEKATSVEEMIAIEERLSEVRYNIESLTSQLKNWDNKVNYSTVTLYISEVKELTVQVPVQRTYWQEIGDGLKNTFDNIGRFFKNLFKFIVVNFPVIIILAVVIAVVILIFRKATKKDRQRVREIMAENEAKKEESNE